MDIQQLKALGLEKRWPRLARLQTETAGLETRLQEAEVTVQQLHTELAAARDADLDAEAKAVRDGKDVPEATQEPKVQKKLDRATRDRVVLRRALDTAQTDHGAFLAKHREALYQDVEQARAEIASSVARAAQEALAGYSKHEDLFYVLKGLQPPVAPVETGPPGSEDPKAVRSTNTLIGVQTTRSSGPARGEVEATLRYLVSLASGRPAQGGKDAAA